MIVYKTSERCLPFEYARLPMDNIPKPERNSYQCVDSPNEVSLTIQVTSLSDF